MCETGTAAVCGNIIVDYGFGPGRCGEAPYVSSGRLGRPDPRSPVCVASANDRGLRPAPTSKATGIAAWCAR